MVSWMCVQAAQGEDTRQSKSWCVLSERKAGDEVEMMVSEVWTRRKKRGAGGTSQSEMGSVCGKIHLSSFSPKLMGLVQSEVFFFPKKLSISLLFCIHYIKRIHLHLISRKLA